MDKNTEELSLDTMDRIAGGVERTVNTGCDLNAAIRMAPAKKSRQIASLVNGTVVDTVSDQLFYDPEAGRNFVEVYFTDKDGKRKSGWIAASIVGLKR